MMASVSGIHPVIVMIFSPIVFKEKFPVVKLLGFLAVVLGMFVVNAEALLQGQVSWGLIYGILAAFTYAFMVIFNKKATSLTGIENSMWQLIVSFITVTAFLGVKQGFSAHIPPGSLIPILVLGIVNTGIGCYFYFSSIGDLPVQTVSILGYLEPLSALFFFGVVPGRGLELMAMGWGGSDPGRRIFWSDVPTERVFGFAGFGRGGSARGVVCGAGAG